MNGDDKDVGYVDERDEYVGHDDDEEEYDNDY